jgi:uroporphyrinogen decarboxylase
MTKKERVLKAIHHKEADRIPKGELYIDPGLSNKLLNKDYPLDYFHLQRDLEVRNLLNIDLINLGEWPSEEIGTDSSGNRRFRSIYGEEYVFNGKSKHIVKPPFEDIEDVSGYSVPDIKKCTGKIIEEYAANTDMFIMAQVGGPISMINEMVGMEDYFVYCMTNTDEIIAPGEKIMEYEIAKAKLFIDKKADAILIADDMAFNSGTFFQPELLRRIAFPFYRQAIKEIKKYKDVPVFLHTDGNIMKVMDDIVEAGFDGLQSLQPSAGMDIARIKKDYGDKLCLMGNIDLDYIMTFASPAEVEDTVKKTTDAAASGGGFILSTCNILVDIIPPENALTMYNTANEYGVYKK